MSSSTTTVLGNGKHDRYTHTMKFDEYQNLASLTAIYPEGAGLLYTTLGLASEAGEVAGKVKKAIRDDGGQLSPERVKQLSDELGDVLWYVAMLSRELGISLSTIADKNIEKLSSRATRGTLSGNGDTR